MIKGASEWLHHSIAIPAAVRAASDEYASTMDALGNWIADRCQLGIDETEAASLLYQSYADWKRARGEHPVSETRFSEQLVSRRFERYRSNGSRYRGIRLSVDERYRIEIGDRP
jgi:putative DNA primase/helicase